eukprot:TRINITY_DN19891_c0_g1_i2.p1 TRINITY_DN19891_c0_g1~~TRINITY_DN19891_c0_g1_i2.p1  ORF type:complete len:118 (-),score=6.10 TRINITY_DN19891_c0_g1_i2:174-527(-)
MCRIEQMQSRAEFLQKSTRHCKGAEPTRRSTGLAGPCCKNVPVRVTATRPHTKEVKRERWRVRRVTPHGESSLQVPMEEARTVAKTSDMQGRRGSYRGHEGRTCKGESDTSVRRFRY